MTSQADVPGPPGFTARIDALFADVDRTDGPGCALAVVQGGEIVHARGYGLADLEHRTPISPDSVFDIGSTSKQFTAACIVLLALDGRLTLDDPVRTHLPELPDYGTPLTLRHLLHHTGGVRDYLTLMWLADLPFENDYPEERITALIAAQRELNFPPGDEHLYSNSGYYLLGEVVRRVSGQSLAQFASERIFGPLGMRDTHFHDDWRRLVPRRAQGYRPGQGGGYELDISLFSVVGDGMVYSTVLDLARWTQVFTDATLLGGPAFLNTMLTTGTLNDGTALTYAAGVGLIGERVSHAGAWAGYRASMHVVPGKALGVVCLSNLTTFVPWVRALQVLDIVQDDPASSSPSPTAGDAGSAPILRPEDLAGVYWSPQSGRVCTVAVAAEGLTVEEFGHVQPLTARAPDTFSLPVPAPPDTRLVFERDSGTLRYTGPTGPSDVFQRSAPPVLNGVGLREYAGEYVSEELNVTWRFVVGDGHLVLVGHSMLGGAWEPLAPGVFWREGVIAQFKEGPSALVVNAGRVKHIRFEKRA
ncbi:serine hydrolase [uncultured Deinococcus sp.]|uniref:serine hydrolase domain-containing protein n=1 Tax=uncultured Deinococcus sp. TaxID=158789 RepID=UPI0025F97902|nr:serine hydrolase domain-containing protein [uncultured Deinococcus sp.]